MKHIDLHTHTIYSDGTNRPKQTVIDCAIIGLDTIAITDHDHTEGYFEAKKEAKNWGIEVLTGVEISTTKYHILGYDFDIKNKPLQDLLEYSRECQENITKKRLKKLQAQGVPLTFENVKRHFAGSRLGKYNIIMTMFRDPDFKQYTKNKSAQEVLKTYVGKGTPAGTIKNKVQVRSKQAIDAIHKAGGIAIVAHPFKEIENMQELDRLVAKGIDGLEIQPNYGDKNDKFVEYAKEKGLIITYGSDYHGSSFITRPLLSRNGNLVKTFWGNRNLTRKRKRHLEMMNDEKAKGLVEFKGYCRGWDGYSGRMYYP